MKLSNIVRNERKLAVEVETDGGTDVINIVYKPSVITPASEADFRTEHEGENFGDLIVARLAEIMPKWDLEDEGAIIPTTEEGLRHVPNLVLGAIWEAIIADISEKKVKKVPTSAGSFAPTA